MLKPSLRIDEFTKTLYGDNTFLTKDKKFSFLSGDATSGLSTIIVQSITGFAVDKILCIGEIGQEKTEIIKTHASTAPSGTTVTLASNLTFSHPQDTKCYIINWDNAEFQHASTASGTKAGVSGSIAIQADQNETLYEDGTHTSGYGFIKFHNSVSGTASTFSDPVPYDGYDDNTVFAIKERALDSVDEEIGNLITHSFLNKALWQGRRAYHDAPGKRPFRRKFNIDIGNVSTGMYRLQAPTDLESPYTAENVYGARIGTEKNMSYYDKKEWDEDWQGVPHTTLKNNYTSGDSCITLDDVRDFEDSGSVQLENDTIEYDARSVSAGTMSVSTDGDRDHTAGVDVYQGASLGLPNKFTVFTEEGDTAYIWFSCPVETSYVDQNIYLDYYRTLVPYDSDADELDEPDYDMFVPYLAYRIKDKKAKGVLPLTDPDYIKWQLKKNNALKAEYAGAEIRIVPDIDHLPLP